MIAVIATVIAIVLIAASSLIHAYLICHVIRAERDRSRRTVRAGHVWFDEVEIEHIAVRAAEVADSRLEALCDEALSDGRVSDELAEQMLYNQDLVQWIEEGRHNGLRRRKVTQ